MLKNDINKKIKEMYVFNENLDAANVSKEKPEFFQAVLEAYKGWDKALKENGINRKRIKEREKFVLYAIMKRRYSENSHKALQKKNIGEIKERIFAAYKTIDNLTKYTLMSWNEDRVMYEIRMIILSGGFVSELESEHPELYEQALIFFETLEEISGEYEDRFGVDILQEEKLIQENGKNPAINDSKVESKEQVEEDPELVKLSSLVELGYITEDQAEEIKTSKNISREEITSYLWEETSKAKVEGKQLNEQMLKKDNPAMFEAIKKEFGTLENAMLEMTRSLFAV